MKNLILYILLLFAALACQQPQSIRPLLEKADSLLVSHPDSAFLMLDTVANPENYPENEYAEWCLLLTQARDKSYREHTSDSLIRLATSYYREHGPALKYATALYTSGRVASELGRPDQAVQYYLEAEHIGRETDDYRLLYLTTSHLARIYGHLHLTDSTLNLYKRSLGYAKLSKNDLSIAYAESYVGRAYSLKEKWDSAVLYYDSAVRLLRETEHFTALAGILNEQAAVAICMCDWDLAESCFQKMDSIPAKYRRRSQTQIDLNRAEFYFGMGEDNLSRDYLLKSVLSENPYTRRGSLRQLYLLEERNGNCNEALRYVGLYFACRDSIDENSKEEEIIALPLQHKAESIQEHFDGFRLNHYIYVVISLLIIALFVCLCIIYYNHLQKQVLLKRLALDVIQKLEWERTFNREEIRKKEAQANSLIASSMAENEILKQQLNDLKTEIAHLKAKDKRLEQEIQERKKKYQLEKTCKEEPKIRESILLFQLKQHPTYIEKEQWPEIFLTMDIMFDNFTKRLKTAYPDLNDCDIQYCCLFKVGFPIREIGIMLMVDSKTVSRRKIEIRKRMHLDGKVDVAKVCKDF